MCRQDWRGNFESIMKKAKYQLTAISFEIAVNNLGLIDIGCCYQEEARSYILNESRQSISFLLKYKVEWNGVLNCYLFPILFTRFPFGHNAHNAQGFIV